MHEAYHMSEFSGSFYPLQDVEWNNRKVQLLGYFVVLGAASPELQRNSHFFMIIYLREFPNV